MLKRPKENCIFKVDHQLRQVNPKAYEPQTISIDPYNHEKEHLKQMEYFKKKVNDLFDISKMPDEESFIEKAISFFCGAGAPNFRKGDHSSEVNHLLGLVYQHCVSQEIPIEADIAYSFLPKLRTMRHAIALEEAGVDFKPKKVGVTSLFDIKFKNGIIEIPTLRVYDNTERILRNLMEYEQFITGPSFVCDYVVFMNCFINTDKDVELLHRREIIDNWLGDHEVVAKMFNRLCDHAKIYYKSYYQEIYDGVDKHCRVPWNRWKATLRHNYFNTPWAIISFLVALLLLLVTVAQFIISFFGF
ncbi:hypothetical protein REPUB_Repub15cG0089500 [Reevesia pubescens]